MKIYDDAHKLAKQIRESKEYKEYKEEKVYCCFLEKQ